MKQRLQSKLGITLVALVVTIIVLIILAGVSIHLVLGENGIVTKAQEGKRNYVNAESYEEEQLKNYSNELDSFVVGNRDSMGKYDMIDTTKNTTTPITDNLYLNDSIYNYSKIDIIYSPCDNFIKVLTFYPQYVTEEHNVIADSFVAQNTAWGIFMTLTCNNEKEFSITMWSNNATFNGILNVVGYK